MAQDDAIGRLARHIDAARKAENLVADAARVAKLRRQGAGELYRICAEFVSAVNAKLAEPVLELSPPEYASEKFREPGVNLIQIGSRGREMQIAFEAPSELVSTEKFVIPYVLEGEIRTYNQEMLERFDVRTVAIFFSTRITKERQSAEWHFYDWRTLHTGPVNRELLASLLEPLF